MINVYNKTTFGRNSIQEIPTGYIDDAANNLFRFMGSFWKNLHEGSSLIKGIQKVRGIKLAQFYLDLLETLKLQDRKGMPVYHRELWKPLIIRKSDRNKSQENVLKLGGDAVIGRQKAGSKYGQGTVLQIGCLASLDKYVTYPVSADIETIVSGITDNIINPTVSFNVSSEFPSSDVTYMNGTLIFPKDKDPFGENSPFYIYDVAGDEEDATDNDQETVLWASDVLIDKSFISTHMSYALGIDCASTDVAKRILNAGWDAFNCGLTPELYRTLLGAMLNIPTIQEDSETVRNVETMSDGNKRITTDKHTYTVYGKANLRKCVKLGSVLHKGDLLDESVKIYPIITDPSYDKLKGTSEYADILKTDVPVISMPKTILRTNTANGLAVDWNPTDVLSAGKDANGHEKLYFDLDGAEEDVESFWEDVWKNAELENVDIAPYFLDCGPDGESSESSDEGWLIVPAKFFLKYMLGANTLIVTLARSQVEDTSMIRNAMFFDILNRVIPSGMRLFFIEHVDIDEEDDEYELTSTDTEEEVDKFAFEDVDEDEIYYNDLPGMKGKRMPTYEDQVEIKLFRYHKRHAE